MEHYYQAMESRHEKDAPLPDLPKDHLIDQRADDFDCLGAGGIALQEVLKGRHLPPIDISEIGMEPHRLRRKAGKFFSDFALARLQCF